MAEFNITQLASLDAERMRRYAKNLDLYLGKQWPGSTRTRSPKQPPRLVFNYIKSVVDKVTSYLTQGIAFPCYPADDSPATKDNVSRAEDFLTQVYEENFLQQLDWETEIDAAILGDGSYKVFFDPKAKRIRVVSPDVTGLFAWWLGDDLASVWRVALRYFLTDEEVELLYGMKSMPRKVSVVELWTADSFSLFINNDLISSQRNPYGFIPFIIFPNLREPKQFWGSSDVETLKECQSELNRSLSQLSHILEVSGNPITVLENIEAQKEIKIEPGAVWTLPEGSKAYLLDLLKGGGVRLHLDYIEILYRSLFDLGETPRAAFGTIQKELSGTALNIEFQSLVQKVVRKRVIRTPAYHRRCEMILKLGEQFLGYDFSGVLHKVSWGPIVPSDVIRQAQSEQLLVNAGIHSRRTAMDALGIQNPQDEFDQWLVERKIIREQNIELPTPSTRGGDITRALQQAGLGLDEAFNDGDY